MPRACRGAPSAGSPSAAAATAPAPWSARGWSSPPPIASSPRRRGGSTTRRCAFEAGYEGGGAIAASGIRSFWIAPGFDLARSAKSAALDRYDYAFILLDEPIGGRTGYFGIRTPDAAGGLVTQAGYAADRPEEMTAHVGCRVLGLYEDLTLAHDCDTTIGNSGSPLFVGKGDDWRILAVSSRIVLGSNAVGVAVDARSFADDLARFIRRYDPDALTPNP